MRCLGRFDLFPTYCSVPPLRLNIYILRDFLDQPQTSVSITHRLFSSPNPPSCLSATTSMSQVSRISEKKDPGMVDKTIDRSIDGCRMGCFLAENTRRPWQFSIDSLTTSPHHAGTCEKRGASDHRIRTSRLENGPFSTPRACTHKYCMCRVLLYSTSHAARDLAGATRQI